MREVSVGRGGLVALIDDEDYEMVTRYSWCVHRATPELVYARQRQGPLMHNVIMGVKGIDHVDHDGLNNQRGNLRVASQARNMANARKFRSASSQFKGVSWCCRERKWIARIYVAGMEEYLGRFDVEEDAARAYDVAACAAWGEYAHLNFGSN